MSYFYYICFKEIKKPDILDFADEVAQKCRENAREIIKSHLTQVPSVRLWFITDKEKYSLSWREADRNWLYDLFKLNFVYWEKYNILGIYGNLPKEVERSLVGIPFHEKEHAYDYHVWDGIGFFEGVVFGIKDTNDETIMMAYGKEYDGKDPDYIRRSTVYDLICKNLELDSLFHGEKGNFREYTIEPIATQKQLQDTYDVLQSLLWDANGKTKAYE